MKIQQIYRLLKKSVKIKIKSIKFCKNYKKKKLKNFLNYDQIENNPRNTENMLRSKIILQLKKLYMYRLNWNIKIKLKI